MGIFSPDMLAVLEPIVVHFFEGGVPQLGGKDENRLLNGLRRLEACKLLGWDEIPVSE